MKQKGAAFLQRSTNSDETFERIICMKYCRTKYKHTWSRHDQPHAFHAECYATTQCFSQHGWDCGYGQWSMVCDAMPGTDIRSQF